MRRILLIIMISSQFVFLSGCWGAREIQTQTFITAIGLDYADGEFTVYIQALNFANIAKLDGDSFLQHSPVLIGEAKGKTIQSAFSKLEQNVALPLYYGHVKTILLSENVIKDQMKAVTEFIGQNSFLRYNCWLFGTEFDIKSIFRGESFLNNSSLYSVVHSPDTLNKNNFFIPILRYNKFISSYHQPVGTLIIPSLGVNNTHFAEDEKKKNVVVITGGFAVSQQQLKGWVSKEELVGLKWLSKDATNIPISLYDENVSVIVQKPKKTIKVVNGNKPLYLLIVKSDAVLTQNEDDKSIEEIKIELEKKINNDILKTIEKSEEIKADLLNLSEKTYRYHYNKWDLNTIHSIDKESIKNLQVKMHIEQNINYKR
ncbi:Ger(x)C family spore germination protein [Cytobacillus horneckiae]|uniref:Ger(x)C family spore germination protein n=1 Tax=Cytobacillus horneckiae TaxID=549687 RepID=UPI00203E766B|nr:Ger(x)C family spore germination protein [Cytobacillus horneckiae]MCM3180715.1 Ger(x)C family spore germination protein [Cytobacillus horneckiae]